MFDSDMPVRYSADIWSCGVTFFELFAEKRRQSDETFKRLPFAEGTDAKKIMCMLVVKKQSPITDEQINSKIESNCPSLFLSLMKDCAKITPEERPNSPYLVGEIKKLFDEMFATNHQKELSDTVTRMAWHPVSDDTDDHLNSSKESQYFTVVSHFQTTVEADIDHTVKFQTQDETTELQDQVKGNF